MYLWSPLPLVGHVSASTFLLTVENDPESGQPFEECVGKKYFFSNETHAKKAPFLKCNCLVEIDLSLDIDSNIRGGNVICRDTFDSTGVLDWDAFVEEQMAEFNKTSTSEFPSATTTEVPLKI